MLNLGTLGTHLHIHVNTHTHKHAISCMLKHGPMALQLRQPGQMSSSEDMDHMGNNRNIWIEGIMEGVNMCVRG